MPLVEQTFLKPNRYHLGGGKYRDLTSADIKRYVDNTKAVLDAGNHVPLILEHAPPGSEEGSPRDTRAAAVKHGVGWLQDVRIGSDGAAQHVLDVADEEVAKKLANGSIKFTSPEFWDRPWTDGKGNTFTGFISHMALTHKPRSTDQSAFQPVEGVAQFSLEDVMADDETTDENAESDKPAEEETKPENPDAPESEEVDDNQAKRAQRIEAVLAHMEKRGISLPADTCEVDEMTLLDRMLTAFMTANAADERAAAEDSDEEPAEMPEIAEEKPNAVQQYSLADVEGDGFSNKLLGRVIKQEAENVRAKLEGMVRDVKISPAARDQLLALDGVMQFSADGEFLPAMTLPQIVDVLDGCLQPGFALEDLQLSTLAESHPSQDFLTNNPDGLVPPEKVDEVAAADMASRPGMYKTAK